MEDIYYSIKGLLKDIEHLTKKLQKTYEKKKSFNASDTIITECNKCGCRDGKICEGFDMPIGVETYIVCQECSMRVIKSKLEDLVKGLQE